MGKLNIVLFVILIQCSSVTRIHYRHCFIDEPTKQVDADNLRFKATSWASPEIAQDKVEVVAKENVRTCIARHIAKHQKKKYEGLSPKQELFYLKKTRFIDEFCHKRTCQAEVNYKSSE